METRVVDRALILLALTLLFEALKGNLLKSEGLRTYIPLMSMAVATLILMAWAYYNGVLQGEAILYSILDGVIVGASATGLYEGSRAAGRAVSARLNGG